MPAAKLRQFLDDNGIKYLTISHSPAYTAQGIAALTHIPGKELAKTVIVEIDGALAMAVLPATCQVDLRLLQTGARAQSVRIATEKEFKERFPECETGAMPPFGNLYGMEVFVEESLAKDHEIVFNAGTHRELIRMAFYDFARLVGPKVMPFAAVRIATAA